MRHWIASLVLAALFAGCQQPPAPTPSALTGATGSAFPTATTSQNAATAAPTSSSPSGPPTHVDGTITWSMTGDGWATKGSIHFVGAALHGIGDYIVQEGSTYVDDFDRSNCDHAHGAGVLKQFNTENTPMLAVGYAGLVGGAGSDGALYLALNGDLQTCTGAAVPYAPEPACSSIQGAFDPRTATYTFTCELRTGATGSLQGTLATSP